MIYSCWCGCYSCGCCCCCTFGRSISGSNAASLCLFSPHYLCWSVIKQWYSVVSSMVSEIGCLFSKRNVSTWLMLLFDVFCINKRHDWVKHEQLNFLVDLLECWHCKQWFGLSIIDFYSPSKFNAVCSSTGCINWRVFQWDSPLHVRFEKRSVVFIPTEHACRS